MLGSALETGMHELAIAQSLIKTAGEYAEKNGASRIVRVELVLGSLTGVEPESLSFCFPMAAAGTPCEGAKLIIEIETAAGYCKACSETSNVDHLMSPCPKCGEWPLQVTGGREMKLRALEVN